MHDNPILWRCINDNNNDLKARLGNTGHREAIHKASKEVSIGKPLTSISGAIRSLHRKSD